MSGLERSLTVLFLNVLSLPMKLCGARPSRPRAGTPTSSPFPGSLGPWVSFPNSQEPSSQVHLVLSPGPGQCGHPWAHGAAVCKGCALGVLGFALGCPHICVRVLVPWDRAKDGKKGTVGQGLPLCPLVFPAQGRFRGRPALGAPGCYRRCVADCAEVSRNSGSAPAQGHVPRPCHVR